MTRYMADVKTDFYDEWVEHSKRTVTDIIPGENAYFKFTGDYPNGYSMRLLTDPKDFEGQRQRTTTRLILTDDKGVDVIARSVYLQSKPDTIFNMNFKGDTYTLKIWPND